MESVTHDLKIADDSTPQAVVEALGKSIMNNAVMPLCIITCVDEAGKDNGLTAGWVSFVNGNPAAVSISIGPKRYSHDIIDKSGEFGVCFLSKELLPLAKMFGSKSGRKVNKFEEYCKESPNDYFRGEVVRVPLLTNACSCLECKVISKTTLSDHTVFIGEVKRGWKNPDRDAKAHQAFCAGLRMF